MAYSKPIQLYPISHDFNVDIRYHKIAPSVVAEYEAREAANFGHYTWEQFGVLDLDTKVECIAYFRMHNKIDAVVQQEVTAYTKSKQRRY